MVKFDAASREMAIDRKVGWMWWKRTPADLILLDRRAGSNHWITPHPPHLFNPSRQAKPWRDGNNGAICGQMDQRLLRFWGRSGRIRFDK